MSASDHVQTNNVWRPYSTALLLQRVITGAEQLLALETSRRPYTQRTARQYERLLEALTAVVDELARRV